jgi:predicted esterase
MEAVGLTVGDYVECKAAGGAKTGTVVGVDLEVGTVRVALQGRARGEQQLFFMDCVAKARLKPAPTACFRSTEGFSFAHSADGVDENLLICLHGLGDSHEPFFRMAATMNLPQTAYLAVRAPFVLPMDLGHSWFTVFEEDGSMIRPSSVERRRTSTLSSSVRFLNALITDLCRKCHWTRSSIFLMGFSQGGTVAGNHPSLPPVFSRGAPLPVLTLAYFAAHLAFQNAGDDRLGGAVLIAAGFLPEAYTAGSGRPDTLFHQAQLKKRPGTPLLITRGSRDPVFSTADAKQTMDFYATWRPECKVNHESIPGKDHCMVNSAKETRELMRFFAEFLKFRHVELEGRDDLIPVDREHVTLVQQAKKHSGKSGGNMGI